VCWYLYYVCKVNSHNVDVSTWMSRTLTNNMIMSL